MDHMYVAGATDLHALVQALLPVFGARRPTRAALEFLGLYLTPAAITRRRKRGTLPVAEMFEAGRYFVTVLAIAQLLVGGHGVLVPQPQPRRRGRPRRRVDEDRSIVAAS